MTMKELAKIADVSPAAVSRYLNGGSLSQEKRERIRKAIEETNYHPDPAAQMLRTKVTNYVGLIVPNLDSDAVARVTRGATLALAEEGYLAMLAETANDTAKEIEYIKLFQERAVAGIILMATIITPRHEEIFKDSSVPIVLVGQQCHNAPCVYHDDYGAAYELMNMILAKGRKKIAYIGVTEKDIAVGTNRLKGAEAAMREHGMDPEQLIYALGDFSVDSGKECTKQLIEVHPDIDGILCATDRMAFGALEALREKHLKVPKDISVAGMDDNWACAHITPNLTSAHFYYKTSGKTVAHHLIDLIHKKDPQSPVMQTRLGYTIEKRDSI